MSNAFSGFMYRRIVKYYIGFLLQLLTKRFKALYHNSRVNTPFHHIRKKTVVTGKKSSNIQATIMHRCRHGNHRPYRLPCLRNTWCEAKSRAVTIPYITCTVDFTGLETRDEGFAPLILLRIRLFLWRLLEPFPDLALFFPRRFMVFVLTCLEGSCSRRYTTFFLSLGWCSMDCCPFSCAAVVRFGGRPRPL
jgi:hypothetical protein